VYDNPSGPVTFWATRAKTTAFDQFCCSADQDLPGQVLEVTVPAAADDMFVLTENYGYDGATTSFRYVLDPTGGSVTPLYSKPTSDGGAGEVFRVRVSGTHVLRYVPLNLQALVLRHWLVPVNSAVVTVDGEAVIGGPFPTGGADRFRFFSPGDQTLLIHNSDRGEIVAPSGAVTGSTYETTCLAAPLEAGWYDFVVWKPDTVVQVESVNKCPNS
jgi:hypothetical protein